MELGFTVPNWTPPPRPSAEPMVGRTCRVELLDVQKHARELHQANSDDRNWAYLPYGPFETYEAYAAWVSAVAGKPDPLFHAVVDLNTNKAVGVASFMRIDPAAGSIEVGHINFSPLLQQTVAGTESMYLMMKRAFELGYRRYEWKCNALNQASRRAAQRFGFSYEGVFRQATVVKGRNRDTAWYACIDREWPALNAAFTRWLDPANFDDRGRQQVSLGALTAPILVSRG